MELLLALLAVLGPLAGLLYWWVRNRARTKEEVRKEAIVNAKLNLKQAQDADNPGAVRAALDRLRRLRS